MSKQYDNYIVTHKANVMKGYEWLCENLPEIIGKAEILCYRGSMKDIIANHDRSKYNAEEYGPYDAYFYGGNKSFDVVQNFNRAWLYHIHNNPHHWQHWVLINDNPKEGEIILEMDYPYIIEMICDWWAFSWSKDNLYEIFNWYDEHKEYMKLALKTRSTVEAILEQMKEKLEALDGRDIK